MSAIDLIPSQLSDASIRAADDAIGARHVIREPLAIAEGELRVCRIALGYADPAASESRRRTWRAPVAAFTDCRGF